VCVAPHPTSFLIRTLNTIPALRSIANDVVLDVLLYLTPNYCYDVLQSVTDQIFSVYGVFNKTFPDFASRGGKFSLVGSFSCLAVLTFLYKTNRVVLFARLLTGQFAISFKFCCTPIPPDWTLVRFGHLLGPSLIEEKFNAEWRQ